MGANEKPRIWLLGFPFSPAYTEFGNNFDLDLSANYRTLTQGSGSLLLEYAAIVWNFTEPVQGESERDRQVEHFLKEGKILVYLLNEHRTVPGPNSVLGPVWSLLQKEDSGVESAILLRNRGRQSSLPSHGLVSPFRGYLESPHEWRLAFARCEWLLPLALNASQEVVGFSLAKYPSNTFFLPPPHTLQHARLFVRSLVEAIRRTVVLSEPSPTWVEQFLLPGMIELNTEIESYGHDISAIEVKRQGARSRLDELTWVRNTLLSADGKNLEKAVQHVLEQIGYNPLVGPLGHHDLTFEYKAQHFLAEVKGATSSASEEHIRQLNAMRTRYIEEKKTDTKGVLIINPWRQFEPEKRESDGRVIFPSSMMTLVEIWKFCLITTIQLLQIYRLHLQGALNPEKLADEIHRTVGPLKGYDLNSV